MNFLRNLFGKKQSGATVSGNIRPVFNDHDFKFRKYKIAGITPVSWEEMYDGRRYEVYRSNTRATALEFLKNIPTTEIPPLFYIIVETPQGNIGKDLTGIFDEASEKNIESISQDETDSLTDNQRASELSDKAAALGEMGRYSEAIIYYDQALQIDPQLTFAWINKGADLSSLNRADEALVCYERACSIEPNLAQAWPGKGVVLIQLDRMEEAVACFHRALQLEPENTSIWFNKGMLHYKELRQFKEALECFDKARSLGHPKASEGVKLCRQHLGLI